MDSTQLNRPITYLIGKQCRPLSDSFNRSFLFWAYSACKKKQKNTPGKGLILCWSYKILCGYNRSTSSKKFIHSYAIRERPSALNATSKLNYTLNRSNTLGKDESQFARASRCCYIWEGVICSRSNERNEKELKNKM